MLSRLTPRQWMEWQTYTSIFLTPLRRADINSALERHTAMSLTPGVKAPRKIASLIPDYGKQRKTLSDEQIREIQSWSKP